MNTEVGTLYTQPQSPTPTEPTEHSVPVESIYIPQDTMKETRNENLLEDPSPVPSAPPANLINGYSSAYSLSDVTQSTNGSPTESTEDEKEQMSRTPIQAHDSISSGSTVRTLQSSSTKSSCKIKDIHYHVTNSLFMDDFRNKHEGDFRFVLQNPRGIKELKDSDPEYYPTVQALREGQCDLMCFAETNVSWHRNDFLYDVSVANKFIWSTPTKTIAASCRSEKKGSNFYQPGGVMNIVANNLTTKI